MQMNRWKERKNLFQLTVQMNVSNRHALIKSSCKPVFLQLHSGFCLRISLLESNYYPEKKNLLNSSLSALFNLKMGKSSELHGHKCHLSHCLSIIHISNIQNNSCQMNITPFSLNSAGNCMFKVNNRNTRTRYEMPMASFWCLYC